MSVKEEMEMNELSSHISVLTEERDLLQNLLRIERMLRDRLIENRQRFNDIVVIAVAVSFMVGLVAGVLMVVVTQRGAL